MKKTFIVYLILLVCFLSKAQITLVGHTMINNISIKQVNVIVKEGNSIIKSFNTANKSDFRIQLDFGKIYTIYFQSPKSPIMHMEIFGNTIPKEKYDYMMGYELNIPFVYKTDEDVDTSVFVNPFHRVIYDGGKRMVDDTAYNNAFAKSVIRKPVKAPSSQIGKTETPAQNTHIILAGKIIDGSGENLISKNKPIDILNKKGQVIKSDYTNRLGQFSFTGLTASEIGKLRIKMEGNDSIKTKVILCSSKSSTLFASEPINGVCEWELHPEDVIKLTDNYFTKNIGGKLISSSVKEKKFLAKKDVYLSNKYNTVIQKTKTNLIGTFVFEDIKPDNIYYISVDKNDIAVGERVDLLSKEDNYIASLDSALAGKQALKINSCYNKVFNELTVNDEEMKMDIKATIFGDNVNNPIGKLKIILLNDNYEVIDSAVTDNFGTFKFKYLPFLKRFYLSAENTDNILDVFKNILIYSSDDNLIKIMTHQKGNKFSYNPVSAEISRLRDVELEDPWLELIEEKKPAVSEKRTILAPGKSIVENILFENNKSEITKQSKEVLDKIILVLNTNKQLKIEVGAHTDSKGSSETNLKLSEQRAKTVKEYMVQSGIDTKRIISKGYGETKLMNKCGDTVPCSDSEHAQNRRIEFKVLGE